jgi:mycoredoxin
MVTNNSEVIFYGDPDCAESRQVKMFLLQQGIAYQWVDINRDEVGLAFVEEVNDGERRVPTLRLTDGAILVEPSIAELAQALGVEV